MKLWLLRPQNDLREENNPWKPWYDKAFGFVIRAETETEARKIADANSGGESRRHQAPWLNPEYSTCIELTSGGPAEMIIQDFASA